MTANMNDIANDELFKKTFPSNMTLIEIGAKLCSMSDHTRIDDLRYYYCALCLNDLKNYFEYSPGQVLRKDEIINCFCIIAAKLPPEYDAYKSYLAFFNGDLRSAQKLLLGSIDSQPPSETDPVLEDELADYYTVFKNRFPAIWPALHGKYEEYGVSSDILDLCSMIPQCCSGSDEAAVDALTDHLSRHPDSLFAKELLGHKYFRLKMWKNAIAYFSAIESPMLFFPNDIYYLLAFSYEKLRDFASAAEVYRKWLEVSPDGPVILNSLGCALFRQKKYPEALDVFKRCLSENRDLPYSADNYVDTLVCLGRSKEALDLINSGKYSISGKIREKAVNAYKNKGAKPPSPSEDEPLRAAPAMKKEVLAEMSGRFLKEKLLEDELEAKLAAGVPVFGKKLKIYERPGKYGRQFIIPGSRIDLLCEDDNGDIYIVELKRDHGYDDVYSQTVRYIEWFEKNGAFKNKKIYGIICMNDPSAELINKVKRDGRIRLFEYSIRYSEIL